MCKHKANQKPPCLDMSKTKKESIYLTPDSTRKGYYPAKGVMWHCLFYYCNLLNQEMNPWSGVKSGMT